MVKRVSIIMIAIQQFGRVFLYNAWCNMRVTVSSQSLNLSVCGEDEVDIGVGCVFFHSLEDLLCAVN